MRGKRGGENAVFSGLKNGTGFVSLLGFSRLGEAGGLFANQGQARTKAEYRDLSTAQLTM